MALPAISLALYPMAVLARYTRSSMLEVLRTDYMRTARSKGISEKAILVRHGLRNALLPVITMAGIQVGHLLGGSVLVETVFGWPGLGRLAFEAVVARDVNHLLGLHLISSLRVVLAHHATELLYSVLDPRIAVR